MTPPELKRAPSVSPKPSWRRLLARAAEEGARRALSDVGLGGKDAVLTIHDMQSLLVWCRPVCKEEMTF